MRLIPLSQKGKNKGKYFAQVDDDDYFWLNLYQWYVQRDSKNNNLLYAQRTDDNSPTGKRVKMHRFILGVTDPNILVDHRDGNGLNCQRHNLRQATYQQNAQNKVKKSNSSQSKHKGVRKQVNGNGKTSWRSSIRVNGKLQHLGTFSDETQAAMKYDAAAKENWGDFAKPNFQ